MVVKFCRYCAAFLPVSNFTVRRASEDGLSFKCRECASRYNAARYATNPAPAKARAKAWSETNPERRTEIRQVHEMRVREGKRDIRSAAARRQRAQKPEHYRAMGVLAAQRRRTRILGVGGKLKQRDVQRIMLRARGHCVYCGVAANLTIDHVRPISSGGNHQKRNLIPCCKPCNSSKNNKPAANWIEQRHGIGGLFRALAFLEGRRDWLTAWGVTV